MAKGRAKLTIGEGLSVWVLEAENGFGDADFHAHHAIQITICLAGALKLTTARHRLEGQILAVAADVRHRFEAHGLLAFIFVEPESLLGRALHLRLFETAELVALRPGIAAEALEPLRLTFEAKLNNDTLLAAGRAFAEDIAGAAAAPPPDARIDRIVDYVRSHLDEPLTLSAAAQGIYLSPSRLRHLFVEQTGLPFKTYVLWLRLIRAVQLYSAGLSLTDAALAAGFSDSAHFSRIFRRTFGLPATALTRF